MEKKIAVQIDHFGIFSKIPKTEEVFFRLGFVAAGGKSTLVPDSNGELPSCLHFVMDNGYMEYMRTWPEDFERCNRSDGGIVYFEFAMQNAHKAHDSVKDVGLACTDVVHAVRYADHGKKKGEAVFECIALNDDILPNTMIGGVDHQTRELFYHNDRYLHRNGAYRIEEICLCAETDSAFDSQAEKIALYEAQLGTFEPDSCIRHLSLLDRKSMTERFHTELPDDLTNVSAVIFKTNEWEKMQNFVQKSGYAYQTDQTRCAVDLTKELKTIIVFEK